MQAITIKITTPSASRGARVKAFAIGGGIVTIGYDHGLDAQGNAEAALNAFLAERPDWAGEWAIGSIDCDYVAVMIPRRFVQARDAVILARRAISAGENNGNPHAKPWGQAITDLTDGNQGAAFAAEYCSAVAKGL